MRRIVRVTEVLNWVDKGDRAKDKPVSKSVQAIGDRGTAIHRYLSDKLKQRCQVEVSEDCIDGVEAGEQWLSLNDWVQKDLRQVEERMYWPVADFDLSGQPDVIAGTTLIDWKTGKEWWWHRWQANAYAHMFNQLNPGTPPLDTCLIVYLNPTTGQWVEKKTPFSLMIADAVRGLAIAYKERRYGDNGTADAEDGTGKVVDSTEILDDRAWGDREV